MRERPLSSAVLRACSWSVAMLTLAAACGQSPETVGPNEQHQPTQIDPPPPPPPAVVRESTYVYLANIFEGTVRYIARGDGPAFSPDGRRIAFHRDSSIYVVDIDGTNEKRIGVGGDPSWSPDARQFAVSSPEGISIMEADGSRSRVLVRHDFRDDINQEWDLGVGRPSWSPDGSRIAFMHYGDGDTEPGQIYVIPVDSAVPKRLTASNNNRYRYSESDPAWSPDGSKIVFWSYGYGIAVINASGGNTFTIYQNFPMASFGAKPRWSADGRTISFNGRVGSETAVWLVPSTGGNASLYITRARDLAWSPDPEWYVYVSSLAP